MLTNQQINDNFIHSVKATMINFTYLLFKRASVKAICNKDWMKFIATNKFLKVLEDYKTNTLSGTKYNEIAFFLNTYLILDTMYNFVQTGGILGYSGNESDIAAHQDILDQIEQLRIDLGEIGVVVKEFFFNDTNEISCIHNFGDIPLEIRLQDLAGNDYEYDIVYNSSSQCTLYWNTQLTGKVIIATVVNPN
jgi:hypothetical protein